MVSICESNIFMLKSQPDDGFLPYNIPKVFDKTGNGITNIKLPEMNLSQCYTQNLFWNYNTYIYSVLQWN